MPDAAESGEAEETPPEVPKSDGADGAPPDGDDAGPDAPDEPHAPPVPEGPEAPKGGDAAPDAPTLEEQLRKEKEALEQELDDSRKAMDDLRRQNESLLSKGPITTSWVLDITVGECEFASTFAYFLEVQLEGHAEKRRTDVSLPAERPVFASSTLLLSADGDLVKEKLRVSAFLNVIDPSNPDAPTAKLLGSGLVSLEELKILENGTGSKRLVRNVSFTRSSENKELTVGRSTLVMQVKALNPEEAKSLKPHTIESALAPSLDRSLWQARPFESRLRVLVHRADALPILAESSHCVFRVAVRLLQPGGHVMHETASRSLKAVPLSGTLGEVWFNQEIIVPLPSASASPGLLVGLALEMVSGTPDGVSTDALLNLQWTPVTMPMLCPVHLYARSSSTAAAYSRPRPGLVVSITREPAHETLDALADGLSHGVEVRVHGVPAGRPLPDAVDDPLLAICPESSIGFDTRSLQIPMVTFFYDQRVELSSFLETHFAATSGLKCFLTPVASGSASSQTPQWNQFVVRCLANPAALRSLALLLFDCSRASTDPDAPLCGRLLGFASLDATALIQSGSDPMSRSFLSDLRLLEAPGASTCLELELRIWPRGGVSSSPQRPSMAPALAPSAPGAAHGSVSVALEQEAKDFRLNHELSVQLSKEFNLRAAALKRAGEEIVALRRQVQVLKNDNKSLRSQIEDEEKLAEAVQHRPPPEGLEHMSAAELAGKLQRTVEKYREEKAKGAELGRRLEDMVKEVNRVNGLERSLDELQQVHLEQNRELQRLQEEGKKLETYRQTAKTQEKVIGKLEKILENSLQEVQKAQKVQVDIERLKTENLKLRERCTGLLTKKRQDSTNDEAQELKVSLAQKDAEISRLQKLASELQAKSASGASDGRFRLQEPREGFQGPVGPSAPAAPAPVAAVSAVSPAADPVPHALSEAEQEQLAHVEAKRFEWEQRCLAAEQRLQMLQQQLTESSKKYGSDISRLEVEIAKKDARIKELEFLMRQPQS